MFTAAQQTSPAPSEAANETAKVANSKVTASVSAGTRIGLVLTQPIQTRYVHRGDDIYAQTTSPVTAGSTVVIPPGAFVQGKVDKIERQGGRGEVRLASLAITFQDGYVANVGGPITLETDDGYAVKDPGKGHIIGAFAIPAAGAGLGALIGHAVANKQPQTLTASNPPGCTGGPPYCVSSSLTTPADTLKDTAIGSIVGLAAGGVISMALLFGGHNFFLEAGAPVSMVLHQPIVLPEDEVAAAIRDAEQHPAPEQPIAPPPLFIPPPYSDPGTCWTPGSPGTPDIDIPGTPPIGDSPGTPPTHIPGIPATPPTPHPCP
ncbi:MAG: hypothetical protein WA252_05705 [Candidatus Sulfotelmatobacter sp.]